MKDFDKESITERAERLDTACTTLSENYPNARLKLRFESPLQLLIASILAAQCRDERVNEVTLELFSKYRTVADFANAEMERLQEDIASIPLFRRKAATIRSCCQTLIEDHGGEVPSDLNALTAVKGIGRKTANMVLGNAFGIPAIIVDTHVLRIANRLGLSQESDRDKVEQDLMRLLPKERWTRLGHLFAEFGREICKAPKAKCLVCPIGRLCPSHKIL
ncbi:endonuclease III [bacterium]|nr:endonuclease III [bacterium]